MTDEKKYNGWTNYDTWLLNLNLTNDESTYNLILEWTKENPLNNFKYNCLRIDAFKEFLEERYFIEEMNIYKIYDSWDLRSWNNINFDEVLKGFE